MAKVLREKDLGVALDIGTTDIKGALLDLSSKKELAKASVPNEQKSFGADVMTRLHLAAKDGGLKELNKKLISAVNKLIGQLAENASADKDEIKKIIAVGNSAMYHLMLMIDPASLARAPFLPAEKASQERNAREIGLDAAHGAVFKFMPNVSGFVGSDILAAILTVGLHRDERYDLIMDMGTNGEIAFGRKGRIFVTSCASGPAFEGRHIKCGMPAIGGAIVRARFTDKKFSFETVGKLAPKGISGSGLIDIISALLGEGVIDKKGRMKQGEFVIYKKAGRKIYITQKDVREVQLAKAAFSSAIEILTRKAKMGLNALNKFYITGTFGKGIDKESARNIGLVPKEVPLDKIALLKEGALSGAREILLDPSREEEISDIAARCEHVELHKDKDFEEAFAAAMHF